jgi:hypothetical protein
MNYELPTTSNLTLSVSNNLASFDEMPSATGDIGPIERRFHPPRRFVSPSSCKTTKTWAEIQDVISTYLGEKNIAFHFPLSEAVFYVKGVPDDSNLNFDIYCCPAENDTFIIEIRRVKGDVRILSIIYFDIKNLLLGEDIE